jgi:hypothetical protein
VGILDFGLPIADCRLPIAFNQKSAIENPKSQTRVAGAMPVIVTFLVLC